MLATDSVSRTHTHLGLGLGLLGEPSAHRALKLGVAQESQICAVLHAGDVDFNDHVYFPESRRELIHGLPAQTWLTTHVHTNLVTTEPPVPKLQNLFMIQLFLDSFTSPIQADRFVGRFAVKN